MKENPEQRITLANKDTLIKSEIINRYINSFRVLFTQYKELTQENNRGQKR